MVSTNPGPHRSSECRTSVEACGEKQNSLLFAGFSLSPWPFLLELKTADQNGRCECSQICLEVHVPLFHVTNKFQYEKLCLIATYLQEFTHPAIREVLDKRLCNLTGIPGHFVGTDMVTEKVRSILWKIREQDSQFTNLNSRIF